MTVTQFRKKVDVARKCGEANLGDGAVLYCRGQWWAIYHDWQCVDVADKPEKLYYLVA